MKLQLPNSVSSAQDVGVLALEIKDFSKWFAHNAIKQRVHAKRGTPPPEVSPAAMELIRSWSGKKQLTGQMLDELLDALEHFKQSAPTLTVTLAAPATNSVKVALVTWCRENIAPNVLVSFQLNTTLLGGMVLRYGSRVFDWSFRRQILAARVNFPEVLRRV
ncbi:MAG: F0F1 ATP synthase subunit delta [Candidatus Saccharimonadales bacterium]